MLYRVMPSPDVRYQTIVAYGQTYTGTPGDVFDVPESHGLILAGNGWTLVSLSGPTSMRPDGRSDIAVNRRGPGTAYFDTTLSKPIVFDGATWRDPATGIAV